LKSCCVFQNHYDDERDKTVFHNTMQDQDQGRFFWSQTSIVLRPTVSNITGNSSVFQHQAPIAGHFYAGSWHATSPVTLTLTVCELFSRT